MVIVDIIRTLSWRDVIDVLFLTVVAYQLFVWFKGTKALRVLIGLVVLGGVYSLAKSWGLLMTTWAFQILWQVLVILLLILFQSEIRQVLEKVSPLRYLQAKKEYSEADVIDGLAAVAFDLAQERTGAILILAREDNPAEFVRAGQPLMAIPTPAIIKSIFNTAAPAHDGAVVVSGGRLTEMGCFLPLTEREDLPEEYGTRHRAAIGLAERTDAVCLVVSEERGQVSSVVGRDIKVWDAPENLAARLRDWLGVTDRSGPTLKGFLQSAFVENWGAKIGALALVSLVWLLVAGAQDFSQDYNVPISYTGMSAEYMLTEDTPKEVSLVLSGPRRQVAHLRDQQLVIRADLAGLPPGVHVIRLTAKDVDLPLGLTIDQLWPQNIKVTMIPANQAMPQGHQP